MKRRRFCGFLFSSATLFAQLSILAAEPAKDTPPSSYFSGEYAIVGRVPDSARTYSGIVRLEKASSGRFRMVRKVEGRKATGVAFLDHAAPAAESPVVLRIRFSDDGAEYEGTFLWKNDLDNYPRLTGFIYRRGGAKTKSAGLEAWFTNVTLPR